MKNMAESEKRTGIVRSQESQRSEWRIIKDNLVSSRCAEPAGCTQSYLLGYCGKLSLHWWSPGLKSL